MNYLCSSLVLLLPLLVAEGGATIASTHELVSANLLLHFSLEAVGKEAQVLEFNRYESGLSPNVCSEIVLYDAQMQPIKWAILRLSSRSQPYHYMKMQPGSPVHFTCEVDTADLRYVKHPTTGPNKVVYKDLRFYKLVYHAPAGGPRNAMGDLESPLFSFN